jgi:hypothetical protein
LAFTLDDAAGDVLSDTPARELVVKILNAGGAPRTIFETMQNDPAMTLRQALEHLSNGEELAGQVSEALAKLGR